MPSVISGLKAMVDAYDLFLIDQFGVLHDGREPYPSAVHTLQQLKLVNKRVVVISNSGKRSSKNVKRLTKMGFSDDLFDDVISSGEVAFGVIQKLVREKSIKSCYLISRDNDTSAVDNLGLKLLQNADEADLILISASEAELYTETVYREKLRSAAAKNTICLCTNPDKKMLTQYGLMFGAGRIAEIYEELGGHVTWIGKPFPAIYQHVFDLYPRHDKNRTLCIGDSVEHDIVGGKNAKVKTLLVRTGIQSDLTDDDLHAQFLRYNAYSDYITDKLNY